MYTSLDSIQTELKRRLDEIETKISAWEKVERKTKKDGGSFSALAKNFVNASIHDDPCSLIQKKCVTVCGWSQYSGYITDEIKTVGLVRYEENREIPESRVVKERMIEPYYVKTVDEIFEDIGIKIESLRRQKEKILQDLESSEMVFKLFKAKIDNALQDLKSSCNQSLYYLCRDYMTSAF